MSDTDSKENSLSDMDNNDISESDNENFESSQSNEDEVEEEEKRIISNSDNDDEEDEEENDSNEEEDEEEEENNSNDNKTKEEEEEENDKEEEEENNSNDTIQDKKDNKLDLFQKKLKNKGIVYISRVPPGMKPSLLKSILSNFCTVERIWCTANDMKKSKKQRRGPSEAWVEISSERKAKKIAKLLNSTPIGVGRYKEDLWTIRFLPGVKWHHLTIQHLHKQKMREQRLRKNIADAKKKTNFFLQQREKQFHEERIKERKRKRGELQETDDDGKLDEKKIKRTYQQKEVIVKNDEYNEDLLMKIAGRK